MNYEELTLNGFVKEMKEVSSGMHPRKFCFVLGAGASKSSGIKSGQELVNIWEEDLLERNRTAHLKWKKQLGINDKNKYEFYSQYYEKRFKKAIDGYNYLEKLMESAKPSIGYVVLSYILTHTKHNVVITTNFDHLLEDTVNYYENIIPLVIGHESLAHYITKQINRPMIIKIHRDLLLDPKNRESELNVLHDDWKKALNFIFSEYYPIFIGYAGNDHSLMDYLSQNRDAFSNENGIFPYWMVYRKDEIGKMVLEFLNQSGGYLIEHDGFDGVMRLLGDIFGYRLPSKEDFIRDAEKRYKTFSYAIEAFTGASTTNKEENPEEKGISCDGEHEASEVTQAVQNITNQTELQKLFREAVWLADTGKNQEAMERFRDLIKKNPQNARYYFWMGVVLYRMGRYEEAEKEQRKAIELEPSDASYYNDLGVTLYKMELYEEAEKEQRKAIELEPSDASYYNDLGITLYKMERYEEAEKEQRKAIELEPFNAIHHDCLGIILEKLGRYEEAEEEWRRAEELDVNLKP